MRSKLSKVIIAVVMAFAVGIFGGIGVGKSTAPRPLQIEAALDNVSLSAFAATNTDLATNIFVQISRKMVPSVVNIFTTATIRVPWGGKGGGPDDLWRKFFDEFFGEEFHGAPNMPAPKAQSLGSGFIIEATKDGGLILTNNHVVEGADEIKVKFTENVEEKETSAEVVGRDTDLDIAILKVKTKRNLQAAALADSDRLEVGEWIAAVGNPFGHGHSVTHGIVSAKERSLPGAFGNYLQVDAPINPGNSGGPLVNLNGEVVGINNAIDARGPGIGFAIPINLIKSVLPQLKSKGRVDRGYIGVSVDDLRPDLAKSLKLDESLRAPIITNVIPGQPAAKAGLQPYDVVTEVNGKPVHNPNELVTAVVAVPPGEKAKLKVIRSGQQKDVDVSVAKRPEPKAEKRFGAPPHPQKQQPQPKKRADTGMQLEQIDPEVAQELGLPETYEGIVVAQVAPGGPAYQAGLSRGDVILEVDRKPVKTIEQFYKVVNAKKTYLLRVRKTDETGKEVFVVATLKLGASEE